MELSAVAINNKFKATVCISLANTQERLLHNFRSGFEKCDKAWYVNISCLGQVCLPVLKVLSKLKLVIEERDHFVINLCLPFAYVLYFLMLYYTCSLGPVPAKPVTESTECSDGCIIGISSGGVLFILISAALIGLCIFWRR